MYDVYGLSTPNDFYYAWPIEEMNAKFPKQARSTPAVGEIVYFEPKSQIYSLQNGRVITVSNTGHMAVVTGANEDGTVNMIDSGSGRGWGNAHTFDPKRSTRFSYYDFR
jgi:surface antigen